MNQPARIHPPSDEIDLIELFQILWKSKTLIIIITLAVSCIAAGYAFLSPPIYSASVHLLPPTTSDLVSYNLASQLTGGAITSINRNGNTAQHESTSGIEPLTPAGAYQAFLRHLNSAAVRRQFLQLPYQPTQSDINVENQLLTFGQLGQTLSTSVPRRANEIEASVTVEGQDPQVAAEAANAYIKAAIQATKEELAKGLAGEIAIRQQSLESQVVAARAVARESRLNYITRLKNALSIAESMGLEAASESPMIAFSPQNLNAESGLLYQRGAQALRLELQQLEQRQNDDPYIAELPNLLKQQALLSNIDMSLATLSVATIDRHANVPQHPVKPKKALILLIGIVLGLMLGTFTAIARHMLKRPAADNANTP